MMPELQKAKQTDSHTTSHQTDEHKDWGLWLVVSCSEETGPEKSRQQQHVTNGKNSGPHWGKQYYSIIIKNGNTTARGQCKSKNTFLHAKAGAMVCKIPIHVRCNKRKECRPSKQVFKQIHCLHLAPGQSSKWKYKSSLKRSKRVVAQDEKSAIPVHFGP
ncbi:ribonuclease pancreatic-like [Gracilinanus agilis]|uniref:ribonuclease pancreatic-like n=1 Tax=Gracilinanus agilis TaxID=191870 RepID=UPI001CFCD43F|nr:ribonuclease pancreatic-like [Gracilinanus agilis]